jgi:hypothetical protein
MKGSSEIDRGFRVFFDLSIVVTNGLKNTLKGWVLGFFRVIPSGVGEN